MSEDGKALLIRRRPRAIQREPDPCASFRPWGLAPEVEERIQETGARERIHLAYGRKVHGVRKVGESQYKTIEESVAEWRARHAILI